MGNRVYISAKLKDELEIRELRNYIWVATNAQEYYKKTDPHITIVPPFTAKDGCMDDVRDAVDKANLKGTHIEVKSVSVYENIHKPYVVQLDIDYGVRPAIELLVQKLSEYSASKVKMPASPHITLFKTQGWWDDIPLIMKDRIQWQVISRTGLRDTSISDVDIDIRQ